MHYRVEAGGERDQQYRESGGGDQQYRERGGGDQQYREEAGGEGDPLYKGQRWGWSRGAVQ